MNNVNNWLHQNDSGNTFDFNACDNGDYIKNMGYQIEGGVVFSASLWGGANINMDWLDGMTGCQGTCDMNNSSVTFSNFTLAKNIVGAEKV
jgi:hypothetical protein